MKGAVLLVVFEAITIHRGLSDQVNEARLLRVLPQSIYDPGHGATTHGK